MVAEIQIHLRSIHRLKQMNHVLYEIVRAPSIEELRLKGTQLGDTGKDREVEMRGRLVNTVRELDLAKQEAKQSESEIGALKKQLAAYEAMMRQSTAPARGGNRLQALSGGGTGAGGEGLLPRPQSDLSGRAKGYSANPSQTLL